MSNMVVRTNLLALNSHRNLGLVGNLQARASRNLSSGFRINSAADDAAGLAISEGMRAQIRGMAQASRNTQDGISLVQTAEGFLQTITELAQRSRVLIVQGANDTNNQDQRAYLQRELRQLSSEMNRIWNSAQFNGQNIFASGNARAEFAGSAGNHHLFARAFNVQIGQNAVHGADALDIRAFVQTSMANITTQLGNALMTPNAAPASSGVNNAFEGRMNDLLRAYPGATPGTAAGGASAVGGINNHATWREALGSTSVGTAAQAGTLDHFIVQVNSLRADLGALQNRMEFTIENLDIARENLSAAESRIRDADMAAEMMRLTQANVLQQAATAMLAQGNQAPQSILQLLG